MSQHGPGSPAARPQAGEPAARLHAAGPPARPHAGVLALGYLLFAVAGAMTAVIEVLLVPSRIGQTLIPLAPVLAVLSNVALPAISRGLTDTMLSAVPPVAGWVVTTFLLASATPEGDVLLPAGDTAYVSYSLLGFGTLAGMLTLWRASRPGPWTGRRISSRLARSGSGSDGGK